MLILINIVLLAAVVAALAKPDKVLSFINASNNIRRICAVAAYAVIWAILAFSFGPQELPERISTTRDAENNKKWTEHALMDSTHMAGDYFNPENSKTTLELAARYEELTAIATHSDYKKDEITDSTVIYFANRNSNTALDKLSELQPAYRARYSKLLGDELWEHDIKVKTLNGGKTIEFIGGIFASNKNIKDFQEKVYGNLVDYGYTRSQYKWIEHDTEYTYFDIK